MNDRLLEILTQRPDFHVKGDELRMLQFFVEYLDHGSLFMVGYEPGEDPAFTFTNDAQHYRFALSEVMEHVRKMKSGTPMNWDEIPFEYVTREASLGD